MRSADVTTDVDELRLVELLEADIDQDTHKEPTTSEKCSVRGAQVYVNRLLVRVEQVAQQRQIYFNLGLSSHSFRRGAAMHANDDSVAENGIIERGGWQLDRVNKTFGYMLSTAQADHRLSRVLSGWNPKVGARLPSPPSLDRPAHRGGALVRKIREVLSVKSIDEAELLAWIVTIPSTFTPTPTQPALVMVAHAVGYRMLFLPSGFALDEVSDTFTREMMNTGVKAQDNTLAFLKTNGSSTLAVVTVIKALCKLHKDEKLDLYISQFHERVNTGSIVGPTPVSVFPAFIRL
ncbi:hypothetical protein PHMEG_0004530 [Phytophthora megakarya]|uniref:Uncharacterized protein n=1 Tax=Phytophthora megakarya TaxID=4795 RepID=A0A225WTL5_9STRA|nr:hypothetical protein PHMEG_0004530 [Phytophthora megakarya]